MLGSFLGSLSGKTTSKTSTLTCVLLGKILSKTLGHVPSKDSTDLAIKNTSDKVVATAVLLLIAGNFMATVSDVLIKSAGHDIPVFQFIFMRALCTPLLLLVFYRSIDWSNLFVGGYVHAIRGNIWVLTSLLLVLSLQLLPLSTANAIFYTVPIMIVVLSIFFLKERLTTLAFIAVVSGFLGVLVILRPTDISWGALYALGFSLLLAISSLLIRKLPKNQSLLHSLWITQMFALPLSFFLCLWEGAALDIGMLGYAIGSSVCGVGYSFCCMKAYSRVSASRVASTEYVGLLFAVLAGWFLFSEQPDIWLAVGATMIIVPIYLIGYRARKKSLK